MKVSKILCFYTVTLGVVLCLGVMHAVAGSRAAGYGAELRSLEQRRQDLEIERRGLTKELAQLQSIQFTQRFSETEGFIASLSRVKIELGSDQLSMRY